MNEELVYGIGVRLTKSEARRLEELARYTNRSKNSVIRCLIRLASPRDGQALELVKQEYRKLMNEREAYDAGL